MPHPKASIFNEMLPSVIPKCNYNCSVPSLTDKQPRVRCVNIWSCDAYIQQWKIHSHMSLVRVFMIWYGRARWLNNNHAHPSQQTDCAMGFFNQRLWMFELSCDRLSWYKTWLRPSNETYWYDQLELLQLEHQNTIHCDMELQIRPCHSQSATFWQALP